MSAVWMCARAELRAHWRAWLVLAIVVGLTSGAAMAAGAGARRTQSAYPRFVTEHHTFDVGLGGIASDDPAVQRRVQQQIVHLPQVADYAFGQLVGLSVTLQPQGLELAFPDVVVGGDPSGRDGVDLDTPK